MSLTSEQLILYHEIGQEHYIRYLGGVTLLNKPESDTALGILNNAEHSPEQVVSVAEKLMYDGLQQVILSAGVAISRDIDDLEYSYWELLPQMRNIVEGTYEVHADRINKMNPAFTSLRPAPLYDMTMYHYLCHGRKGKIKTLALLGVCEPAEILKPALLRRTLPLTTGRRVTSLHSA